MIDALRWDRAEWWLLAKIVAVCSAPALLVGGAVGLVVNEPPAYVAKERVPLPTSSAPVTTPGAPLTTPAPAPAAVAVATTTKRKPRPRRTAAPTSTTTVTVTAEPTTSTPTTETTDADSTTPDPTAMGVGRRRQVLDWLDLLPRAPGSAPLKLPR